MTDPKPHLRTGAEVRAQLDALVPNEEGGFVGYGEEHMWTHKSGLTRLSYFDDLLLPHNIDVMHTEKNIAEALWGTLMDTDKSKDNVKARVDLATLCDRPKQEMSTLWLNRPCRCTIRDMPTKTKRILRVGLLCTRCLHTVNYLPQTMMITTSTQTHMMDSSIKKMGYQARLR